MFVWLVAGCGRPPAAPCECADGHGVALCARGECTVCQCLPSAPPTADPLPARTRFVDADAGPGDGTAAAPWPEPDWGVLDQDVAEGHVRVVFDAGDTWPRAVLVLRTDAGPHRIVLDGGSERRGADGAWVAAGGARAGVPGISTGFDEVVRSRVTVRGFDVTHSDDKGIYWRGGDEIVIEDNLVHDNGGTPAISLDYTSRTGHRSTSFVVRNNHVWDQRGECIYIGGAEGEDIDSHELVVVENNLVHDCTHPLSSKHDGINIKDRIGQVTVAGNVVFATNWGIEISSPGEVRRNLIFSTTSNGVHATDEWGRGLSGLLIEDLVVLDAGDAGVYLNGTNHPWTDVALSRVTIAGARQAAFEAGGDISGTLDDLVLSDAAVGLDGWSPMGWALDGCTVFATDLTADRSLAELGRACVEQDPGFGDLGAPAGPDGRFFTDDDPWIAAPGGARP